MRKQKQGFAPILAIILVLLVLGSGGAYYAVKKQKKQQTPPDKGEVKENVVDGMMQNKDEMMKKGDEMIENGMMKTNENMMIGPKTHKVEMTSAGFSPKELKIKKGDAVEFVNKDSRQRWPASGVHPAHQMCPGFDALKQMSPGETYSFTFNETKTCPMHDHMMPNLFGKIIVE